MIELFEEKEKKNFSRKTVSLRFDSKLKEKMIKVFYYTPN